MNFFLPVAVFESLRHGLTPLAKAPLILGACLLSVAAVCRAQGEKLTVKTTLGSPRVVIRPGGQGVVVRSVNLSITNNYTQPITALVIWGDGQQGTPLAEDIVTADTYIDSVIHEKDQPILPGQTRTEKSSDSTARFRTAIFADGAISGDPTWGDRVIRHRQLYLQMIDRFIGCIETILLAPPDRIKITEKLSPCPWDLNPPGLTVEQENIFFPLSKDVSMSLGYTHQEPKGPSIGNSTFGWFPVARITGEAQKLRALRTGVANSIPARLKGDKN